jgi:hypothetical protein
MIKASCYAALYGLAVYFLQTNYFQSKQLLVPVFAAVFSLINGVINSPLVKNQAVAYI